MSSAAGAFQITSMEEHPYHQTEDGVKLTRASGTQRFSGEVVGDGTVEWLMCYLPGGSAAFVGLQRIQGRLGARSGAFVMEANGTHDGEASKATWSIVEGSGTGELQGIRGEGSFDAPGGPEATYTLSYDLAEDG